MKYVKMLGLAAIAAMALSAVAGASTASATELCSTNTSPCSGTMYPVGTEIKAELKAGGAGAVITNNITNWTCKKSAISGKTTTTGSATETVLGQITALTFTECTNTAGEKCTAEAVHLPYKAEIHATGGGNGTLTVSSGGNGNPGEILVCGTDINCTFSFATASLSLTGGNPAILKAGKIKLETAGGICPAEASWDAEYEVTSPKPLFVV
jgi:hypothetical protein